MIPLITKSLPFLNRLIPAGIAVKGLSKADPRLSSFIQNAVGAGYTTENVLDYLRDRMRPEGDKMEEQRLENAEGSGNISSQEQVALAKRRQEGGLGKLVGTAAGIAAGLGGLGSKGQNAAPMPPPAPKIPPPAPKQANQQADELLATELDNLYTQNQQAQQNQGQAKQQGQAGQQGQIQNPIEQLAPGLHKHLIMRMRQGFNPSDAFDDAKDYGYLKDIETLSRKLGTRLFDVLNYFYGKQTGQAGQQGQQGMDPQLSRILQQGNEIIKRYKGRNG